MTLTQKMMVLKLKPQAKCIIELTSNPKRKNYVIKIDGTIYGSHARQNWAWAQAHRTLLVKF